MTDVRAGCWLFCLYICCFIRLPAFNPSSSIFASRSHQEMWCNSFFLSETMSGSITSLSPCKMANGQLPHHYQQGQHQALEYTLSQAPALGGQDSPLNAGTPSMISSTSDSLTRSLELFDNFLIGVHRKMVSYFIFMLVSQFDRRLSFFEYFDTLNPDALKIQFSGISGKNSAWTFQ